MEVKGNDQVSLQPDTLQWHPIALIIKSKLLPLTP